MSSAVARPQPGFPCRIVFILGCARSGTTWLQLLLFQHPLVASSQETNLFSHYLGHLAKSWSQEENAKAHRLREDAEVPEGASTRRHAAGLSGILEPAEFEELMREFALAVFTRIAASKPNAEVLVEKTPAHTHQKDLILRLFPDAHFIHIIRDPRSVVVSLREASNLTGFEWARTGVVSAAKYWRKSVQAGREFSEETPSYREVHFEHLHSEGPAQLQELFSWLGLDADREFCERAFAACDIANLRSGSEKVAAPWSLKDEPTKFFRRGAADGWRDELSKGETRAVEHIAGELMDGFGYERSAPVSRKPFRVSIHDALEKSAHGLVNAAVTFSPRMARVVRDSLKTR